MKTAFTPSAALALALTATAPLNTLAASFNEPTSGYGTIKYGESFTLKFTGDGSVSDPHHPLHYPTHPSRLITNMTHPARLHRHRRRPLQRRKRSHLPNQRLQNPQQRQLHHLHPQRLPPSREIQLHHHNREITHQLQQQFLCGELQSRGKS